MSNTKSKKGKKQPVNPQPRQVVTRQAGSRTLPEPVDADKAKEVDDG